MKLVTWTDENGYKLGAFVRTGDPDEIAKDSGLPCNPPDLDGLDWEEIKCTLHNQLADRGLFTWQDVQAQQNGLTAAILASLKKPLQQLYRR